MTSKLSLAFLEFLARWRGWRADSYLGKLDQPGDYEIAEVSECVRPPSHSLLDIPLLAHRLDGLAIEPDLVRERMPDVFGNLVETCAGCCDKERCAHDFAEDANPRGWESYCPNAGTLKTLA